MRERRVRFTATAQAHIHRERQWWLDHRDHREIFAAELEEAVKLLTLLPGQVPHIPKPVWLPAASLSRKVGCHIYYTFDDDQIIVRALWGARRSRGPSFESSKSK